MEKAIHPVRIYTTADMIDALTQANMIHATEAHRHLFREALRALVNLAKAEKLLEIKQDTLTALGLGKE